MVQKILFNYKIAKPLEPGTRKQATITDIEEQKAEEIFGPNAKNPDQLLFVIRAKVDEFEGRIATITKPLTNIISPRSRLALFKAKYGEFPKIGMKVQVETNENGFWNLIL